MKLLTPRGLTPRTHGAVDYLACAGMFWLPGALGLPEKTRRASQLAALSYLGVAALTDYPLALRRVIPFRVHGQTELLSVPLLALMPRLLDANTRERQYWHALAGLVSVAYLGTDWKADPDE
ncbi:hypothetical protein [Deinococcus radiophilus]|uniref:Uncharacterized protein n=1 Tax=Deinococcus radiophilus TaxID=32062 RepID=A0A431VUA9_9DEIO|nr:hypothetical protein [Deinococcus radiophilus]RTR26837.1 hypothetical protein EJ104_07515 [Deinococcus radiophilus]